MGIRNYLIEGVSGAGKTTVAEDLQRRGYDVIHGDRVLAYVGDPETGEPLDAPPRDIGTDSVTWGYEHWIWPVGQVKALIADRRHAQSFFCGGARNYHRFIDLFDGVFVLEVADLDTLSRRVAQRGDDEFGGKPAEWAVIARVHATKEGLPPNAVSIDATAPVTRVVDAILSKCSELEQQGR